MDFSKNIPKYLVEKGNLVSQVAFTAIFTLFFINLFQPYGSRDWIKGGISEGRYFLLSSLLVVIGMMVVSISRLPRIIDDVQDGKNSPLADFGRFLIDAGSKVPTALWFVIGGGIGLVLFQISYVGFKHQQVTA